MNIKKKKEKIYLIQEGIHLDYFDLEKQDKKYIVRFNQNLLNNKNFLSSYHEEVESLIFRADFPLNCQVLSLFPGLKSLGLVSTGKDNIFCSIPSNVQFYHAAGFNSRSVAQYTYESLLYLFSKHINLLEKKILIIGFGNIGKKLAAYLENSGLSYAVYDPFVLKDSLLANDAEIVTFHVPLTKDGKFPTFHMIHSEYTIFQKKNPWVIQTSRGKIWNLDFYKEYFSSGKIWSQDVYYYEPPPSNWINYASLSTPHIAGYSFEGKLCGTKYILENILQKKISFNSTFRGKFQDLHTISEKFKQKKLFTEIRTKFIPRKEWKNYSQEERKIFIRTFSNLPKELTSFLWEI